MGLTHNRAPDPAYWADVGADLKRGGQREHRHAAPNAPPSPGSFESIRDPSRLRAFPVDHPGFLILGRWAPLGFHMVNSAAGVFRVPLRRHAWCAAIGTLPVAVLISTLAQLVAQPN